MSIDPEHDTIDDDGREAGEQRVPFGRRQRTGRRRARTPGNTALSGKWFEAQEQPVGIVGDIELEGRIGREAQRHLRALEVVAGSRKRKAR